MKKRNATTFLAIFLLMGIQLGFGIPKYTNPRIKKSNAAVAPTITATGNALYCPLSQTKIVTAVTITHDPTELTTDAISIQIASGYAFGEDQLSLSNPLLHPSIAAFWNAAEGKLLLSSPVAERPVNYSEFEAAIRDLVFFSSNANPTGIRNFSITLGSGKANYLPRNGHYYEYVPSVGITWTDAKNAAAAKTFYGLQGYLATLTAADETQLAGKQAPGTGWIGGTDEATEGVWKWVTGPEGLANGGTGTIFWNGVANGNTPNFAFWNTSEPNNLGNEDYAHITAPGVGVAGSWNDLTNTGASSGSYQPKGYIVEYGGMVPGDVSALQFSTSTTLTMSGKIATTTSNSNCGPGAVTLSATATFGTIDWFTTNTGGSPIASGLTFTTPNLTTTTTYYVSAGCSSNRTLVTATIHPVPLVSNATITQCDADLISDGKTVFNLTVSNPLISANHANETFQYYTAFSSATTDLISDRIPNELAFENATPSTMNIGVRVIDKTTACAAVAQITLLVPTTNFQPTATFAFTVCDDFLDANGTDSATNNNQDGIASFNFSSTRAAILSQLPSGQTYTLTYYKNQADALSQLNAITTTDNYRNIGYPNSQAIWVRIDTNIANSCVGLGPYIQLNVEALPTAYPVSVPRLCTSNANGTANFDTSTLETTVLNGQTNVSVRYVDQNNNPLQDANGTVISSPFPPTFTTATQSIKAIVSTTSPQQCVDETTISFFVDAIPTATAIAAGLTSVCDDEVDPVNQDGKFGFDTASFETTILAGQTGMTVRYYDQNNLLLPSPLPNPFVTGTQNITARVVHPLNPSCAATVIIPFIVHPVPTIELNTTQLICSNIPAFFVSLDAGFLDGSNASNFNYNWKKEGVDLGVSTATLGVNAEGKYTVDVTNSSGCSKTRTLEVIASNAATITSIAVVDLEDNNTVTINTTGPGEYEYSLDYLNGLWQDSNFFANVIGGIHRVLVNDKNGCGLISKEITVLSIPKFFTPNNDSYNDFWSVKGMASYPNSELRIFDRYGKILKELRPTGLGWDGTLNGQPLPASDYWYVFKIDANSPEKRGHFTLKR